MLALFLAWQCILWFLMVRTRHFWYDELLTLNVSNLHPFSLLWRALLAGADGMPAGYYALVQIARMIPANPHVTLRLPSLAGYILSLLGLYWFAAKRLPAFAASTAVLLAVLSPFRDYALEARSYTLLVGFLAVAAACWQRIDERRYMTPLFAVFLTFAVACHHLALLAIAPFALAELAKTFESRRVRPAVCFALLFAVVPFVIGSPALLNYRKGFGTGFWSQPQWPLAISTYHFYTGLDENLAAVLIFLLALSAGAAALLVFRRIKAGAALEDGFHFPELLLLSGFLLYPVLLVVGAKLLHSGFVPRYGWPAILGLILLSLWLLNLTPVRYSRLLTALFLAFLFQSVRDVSHLRKGDSDERWSMLEKTAAKEPQLPVVIGSPLTYLEALTYAPPALKARLTEITDPNLAIHFVGSDTTDRTNRVLAQFIPIPMENVQSFEARHQRWILYSGGPFDWFSRYLLEQGYHLKLLSSNFESTSTYLVER